MYTNDAWDKLIAGVINQAVKDYKDIMKGKRVPKVNKNELREFFMSERFFEASNIDGSFIVDALESGIN